MGFPFRGGALKLLLKRAFLRLLACRIPILALVITIHRIDHADVGCMLGSTEDICSILRVSGVGKEYGVQF
jgi:hypothetical protein